MPPAPSKADQLYDQGKALLKERKIDEAVKLFEQAIQENSRHVGAHESMAAIYFSRKDYPKAAEFFEKATKFDPRRIDPLINLGAVQNRMEDYQAAAKTLRLAVSRDRKNPAAYYNLAIAQKGLNQPHLAVSAYKEVLKLDPKMIDALQNLANLYLDMGNIQQAQFHFHKALELDPKFEKARRGLERCHAVAEEKKREHNPFGRLVNMEELANRAAEKKLRTLTPQERFDDRNVVHQLAKECEQSAIVMLNTLRDRVGPALTRLNHSLSQSEDPFMMLRESEALPRDVAALDRAHQDLRSRIHSLKEHEKMIRE